VVRTNTTATPAEAAPTSLCTPSAVSSTQTWIVSYASTTPSDTKGQYTIPLPSANFNYWAVPDRVQLRLAVAETMSRPELSYLAPTENPRRHLYRRPDERQLGHDLVCGRTAGGKGGVLHPLPVDRVRAGQRAAHDPVRGALL
jgi:hypothetical protein